MKLIPNLICAVCILSGAAWAQSPVTLAIDTQSHSRPIPADFIGLSFETEALQHGGAGVNGWLFDSTNKKLLVLFKNLGIKNLRIGGTSVDTNKNLPIGGALKKNVQ